jgi:hypothetical protein
VTIVSCSCADVSLSRAVYVLASVFTRHTIVDILTSSSLSPHIFQQHVTITRLK